MRNVSLDFETYYRSEKKNPYSIRNLGNWGYVNHPEFEPYLISVCDGSESWCGPIQDFCWESLEGATLLSHNRSFDEAVYQRMAELKLAPAGLGAEWHCTADLSSYLCNRRSLKDATEHLLGIKVSKDVRDRADGKHWADMVAEGWSGDMIKYGHRDAVYCQAIWEKYGHRWPEKERRLSDLNIKQGMRGVGIDVPLLYKYISDLEQALFEIDKHLPWIAEGLKPTSTKGIAAECRKAGIPNPPLKGEDAEGFDEWEALYAPRFPWVLQVGHRRSLNKALANLRTVQNRLRPDGTMGFAMKYFGAATGRYSGDSGFNMQNLKRIPILLGDDYLPISDSAVDEAVAKYDEVGWGDLRAIDARKILVPRKAGNKFVMCDLSQIEPRVLNWLAGNHEFLARITPERPIYQAYAEDFMGWTGGPLKKHKLKYALTKVQVLGLGYQCGWDKFTTVAWTLGRLRLSEEESKAAVADFRANNPKVVALWEFLHQQLRDSANRREKFEMTLPSGRVMTYEDPRIRARVEADEEGKPVKRYEIVATVGNKTSAFYGGKLTENATQAAARDVFVEHLLSLDDHGIDVVWSVHDEAITEVPGDYPAGEIQKLMSVCPDWLPGCPIAAEAQEGFHYTK